MKALITILFLFLLPCNTVTYTQSTSNNYVMEANNDKKAREAEFNSALSDLTAKDIQRAKDFQGWVNEWMVYVDKGLTPHPKHKPPF